MTDRPLILVGAGGLAREALAAARAAGRDVVGMCDDTIRSGTEIDEVAVLGPAEAVHDHPEAAVLLCTGSARDQASRLRLRDRLGLPPDRYATLVHPAASLARGVELGEGAVLLAGVVVTAPQRVGAHTVLMPQAVLTHDDAVGDFTTMAARVALAGGVSVGTGAYLGAGALVREGLAIGEWSLVGMGSVVLSDVPAREAWAGNPARRLRPAEVRLS